MVDINLDHHSVNNGILFEKAPFHCYEILISNAQLSINKLDGQLLFISEKAMPWCLLTIIE